MDCHWEVKDSDTTCLSGVDSCIQPRHWVQYIVGVELKFQLGQLSCCWGWGISILHGVTCFFLFLTLFAWWLLLLLLPVADNIYPMVSTILSSQANRNSINSNMPHWQHCIKKSYQQWQGSSSNNNDTTTTNDTAETIWHCQQCTKGSGITTMSAQKRKKQEPKHMEYTM